jgi:phosphoglycerate dehydrogenase-like enzyme
MIKSAFVASEEMLSYVYARGRAERIAGKTDLLPKLIAPGGIDENLGLLADREVIFSTWGFPALTTSQIDAMPNLRAVFYAAGTVQYFARPLLERGIAVVSAWAANAIPVAEFASAQIILAMKGYFYNIRHHRAVGASNPPRHRGPGSYGDTVALLGAGMIGRKVIELLKRHSLSVIVFDPFLSDASADALGVRKVSLDEAFSAGLVVSNHLANNARTAGTITGAHIRSMRPRATFINTGRGATVREMEMIDALAARPDLTALIDVTDPDYPHRRLEWNSLPNVWLSDHIAGAEGDEVVRMADFMIEEFERWQHDLPLEYAVTLEMLETMA